MARRSTGDPAPTLMDEKGGQVTSIKQDCEAMWQQILQLQQKVEKEERSLNETGAESLETIYSVKEKQLKAEIETVQQSTPNLLPKDKETLKCIVKEMLTENNRQLEEVLDSIKMERKELEDEIEVEKKLLLRQEQLNASLEAKLTALNEEPASRSVSSVLEELSQKHKKVAKYNKTLQRKMVYFMQELFPGPTEKDKEKFRKRESHKPTQKATGDYDAPEALLESLMNRCLETPHDPYITLKPCHYPPFVELLLRTGIASRHPEDDRKIKLTPYHL